MPKIFRPTYTKVVNGKRVKKRASKWYTRLPGSRKAIPLCTNRQAAEQLAAQLLTNHERAAVGLDDYKAHGDRPVHEHIDEWIASLSNRCTSQHHVHKSRRRVERAMRAAGVVFLRDLDGETILDALAGMEKTTTHPGLPPQDWFTLEEAAALLGISPKSVAPLARRHGMPARGSTHKRQYPRCTIEALLTRKTRGTCASTVNVYIASLKSFARWLVKRKRLKNNPLADLELRCVRETRHARRALSAQELAALLAAARASTWVCRGLTGEHRYYLYLVAMSAGLRRSELASLTPESFGTDCRTVTVAGLYTKNKRAATQPLPTDVAAALREWLTTKPAGVPLWPGKWLEQSAEMIYADGEAAGIPQTVPGPDGPLYADFHCLRASYITLLIQGGANPKVVQQLARHSTIHLTFKHYVKAGEQERADAVNGLPRIAG